MDESHKYNVKLKKHERKEYFIDDSTLVHFTAHKGVRN